MTARDARPASGARLPGDSHAHASCLPRCDRRSCLAPARAGAGQPSRDRDRLPQDGARRRAPHRRGAGRPFSGKGRRAGRGLSRRRAGRAAAWRALGRLVELLGRRRRDITVGPGRQHRAAPSHQPQHARPRRRADGSRIPAHGADQVQSVREQDLRAVRHRPQGRAAADRRLRAEGVEGDAARPQPSELPRCEEPFRRGSALQRPADPLPHHGRHLQRHRQSRDGLDRHVVCPQRAVRVDLSGSRARPARAQPPWRAHLAAQARSAGDQPQAVHARPDRHAGLQQGARHARRRRRLRLPEGAVLQRDRGVLDPVHDA